MGVVVVIVVFVVVVLAGAVAPRFDGGGERLAHGVGGYAERGRRLHNGRR
ncbi:MAG TPA: hypothetical protein VFU43_23720 [Streptosporangiaceae bacterium]|nr:hypothetical protein [Streptosporangiaceae bacterium]